jgi:hypothetical protein
MKMRRFKMVDVDPDSPRSPNHKPYQYGPKEITIWKRVFDAGNPMDPQDRKALRQILKQNQYISWANDDLGAEDTFHEYEPPQEDASEWWLVLYTMSGKAPDLGPLGFVKVPA